MPKPKTGGGAPAARSVPSIARMVEAHLLVGAGDAGAGDAIGVAAAEPGDPRAAARRGVLAAAISTGATPCARAAATKGAASSSGTSATSTLSTPGLGARRVESVAAARERRDWHR